MESKGRYSPTEYLGVNAVERAFLNMGWIFRSQPIADMGIDAHIEFADANKNPSGRLIALQIKSGRSHVRETEYAYTYSGELVHLDYWINHSLPVVLIIHFPDSDATYWVHVDAREIKRHKKSWTLEIPKVNTLDDAARPLLEPYFDGSPGQQRMHRLSFDEALMRHVQRGRTVSLELEDWLTTRVRLSESKVWVRDGQGADVLLSQWRSHTIGFNMTPLAEALFPWATVSLDQDLYDRRGVDTSVPLANLFKALGGESRLKPWTDSEGAHPYIRETIDGQEVDRYRFKLGLNDLGKAFLLVSDYAAREDD